VWYSCLLDSVLYKLDGILGADELLSLPLNMIVLIPRARRTRPTIRSFQRSRGVSPVLPSALGVLADLGFRSSEPFWQWGGSWVLWRAVIWARSWSFRYFNPPIHGPHFLNGAPLALSRDRVESAALPSPPLCQLTFEGVGLHTWIAGGCLRLPPVKVRR